MHLKIISTALVFVSLVAITGLKISAPPGEQLKTFADSFLGNLSPEQKSVAVMAYDSAERVDWHFIPKPTRKGLVMREMNDAQRTAALRLIRAALSEVGYDKASQIMLLEGVLNHLEGENARFERDPQKYYLTIFGTPSNEEEWGLSFEGHHLSLNFVCRGGRVIDSTPQFLAANPATVMNDVPGPIKQGTRVLRAEEQLAFDLVNSLAAGQRQVAVIAQQAPREIRFAGQPQADVGEPEGIAWPKLSEDQQNLLQDLVLTYVDAVADDIAKQRRESIERNGWENIHFAWAGATKPGIGHYYRIRGSEFLIEFVNTQPDAAGNSANHIHCVWRDITGDFGLPAR